MAVNGISIGKMDWTGALNALNAIKGVKAVKEDGAIRITRTNGDNTETLTLEMPNLDDPDVFSPAELESLIKKFDNLRNKGDLPTTEAERLAFVNALKNAFNKVLKTDPVAINNLLGAGPKRGASKSLFDVYAIFKLLITVAQLQRNALRDVRQAENAGVQKAILDQAAEQRSAALAGLIGAVAVCGVQLAAQGAMAVVKFAAAKIMDKIKAASGVDAAKSNLKTAQLADDPKTAKENLKKLGKDLGFDEDGHSIRQKINGELGLSTGTDGDPLGAGKIADQDKNIVELDKQVEDLDKKIDVQKTAIGKLDKEIGRKDGDINNQKLEVEKLENKSSELGDLKKLESDKAELTKQKTEFSKELHEAQDKSKGLESRFNEARDAVKNANPPSEKQKQELAKLKDELNESEKQKSELKSKIDDCEKKLGEIDKKIARKKLLGGEDGNGGLIKNAKDKLKDLEGEKAKLDKDKTDLGTDLKKSTQVKDELVGKRNNTRKEICDKIQKGVPDKVDQVEKEYKQKFDEASAEYRGALKTGNESAIEKAKMKFEQAQKEYEYVHAAGIEAKIGNGGMPREEVAKQYLKLDAEQLDGAENKFTKDPDYAKYEQDKAKYNVIDGVIQSTGQVLQQVAQQISQLKQAKAHALGAREQEARNELDQVNDLFANCQKLLEAVLQAMMAVIQAESQSVDNAIQGLRG